jgi:hypothetical protein
MATTNSAKQLEWKLRALDEFRRKVSEMAADEVDTVALEEELRETLNAVGMEVMGEVLARADTKAPTLEVRGERWGNRRETMGTYTTLFGEVKILRSTYSPGGGGKVMIPLDLRLGIVERRYTPKVARILTHAVAVMTSQEAEGFLKEVGLAAVSRSTIHRLPQAVAARHEELRDAINEALRESDSVPTDATVVQACLDGVMVPQDGEHARPRGRKTTAPKAPRHEARYQRAQRSSPQDDDEEDGRAWHEAMVGTLAFWNAEGEHLKTIYIARMPESGHETVASELELELHAILRERPDLDVSFASDGDAAQWHYLEGIAAALPDAERRTTTFNLDFWHAAGYVDDAAKAALEDDSDSKVQAEEWKTSLKEHVHGATRVLKSMRYFRDQLSGARRETIETSINYLAKQASAGRMKYRTSRDLRHPIGSGPVEAAAKTLVDVRMRRSGARYDQHGGQTILNFRSALYSDRFAKLWDMLHQSYTATVREAA